MMRRKSLLGLAFLCAFLLTAAGGDPSALNDNFNDGDDDGWTHEDFTAGMPWGPGIYDASSKAYHLQSTGVVPVTDPNVGTVDANWGGSHENPTFANGTLRGTFRADTEGSTVGFLLRSNDEKGTDYGFYGSTSFGTFYIERYDLSANPSAPPTVIAIANPRHFPFVAGQDYHVEASVVGNKISMRAWEVGCHRPRRPMLRLTDSGLEPDSGTEVCVIVLFDPVPLSAAGVTGVQVS